MDVDPDQLTRYDNKTFRPFCGLHGKCRTAMIINGCVFYRETELSDRTPVWDEVELLYDFGKERLRYRDYRVDLKLNKVKPCL